MSDVAHDTREVTSVVDAYVAMLNEPDPTARLRLIERAWIDDCRYRDPLFAADGHTGLNDMVTGAREAHPSHSIRRVSGIDVHHDQLRFAWELVKDGEGVVGAGIDCGALADDGRLHRLTGFFGEPPSHEAA